MDAQVRTPVDPPNGVGSRKKQQPRNPHGMRRGTNACTECRRRRAKCRYPTASPPCINCQERGDTCTPQVHKVSLVRNENGASAQAVTPSTQPDQLSMAPVHQVAHPVGTYFSPVAMTAMQHMPPFSFNAEILGPDGFGGGQHLQSQQALSISAPIPLNSESPASRASDQRSRQLNETDRTRDKDEHKDKPLFFQYIMAGPSLVLKLFHSRTNIRAIIASTAVRGRPTAWSDSDFPPILIRPKFHRDETAGSHLRSLNDHLNPKYPTRCAIALASLALTTCQSLENPACRLLANDSPSIIIDLCRRLALEMISIECPESITELDRCIDGVRCLELLCQLHKKIGRPRAALLLARRAISILLLLPEVDLDRINEDHTTIMSCRLNLLDAQLSFHLGVPMLLPALAIDEIKATFAQEQHDLITLERFRNMIEMRQTLTKPSWSYVEKHTLSRLRDFRTTVDDLDIGPQAKWIRLLNHFEVAFDIFLPFMTSRPPLRLVDADGKPELRLEYHHCLEGILYGRKMLQTYLKKHDVGGIAQPVYDEFLDFRVLKVALNLAVIYLSPLGRCEAQNQLFDEESEDQNGWDLLQRVYDAFEESEGAQIFPVCRQARQLKDLFAEQDITDFEPCSLNIPYFGKYSLTYDGDSQNTVLEVAGYPQIDLLPSASELGEEELLSDWRLPRPERPVKYAWRLRYTSSASGVPTSVMEQEDGTVVTYDSETMKMSYVTAPGDTAQ